MKILLAVDGSDHSERVARHVVRLVQGCADYQVILLNVQAPVDAPELLSHMPIAEVEAMQETRGGDALAPARALLDAAGVAYEPQVALGPVAETIAQIANEHQSDAIVIGLRGTNKLVTALMGSVARHVFALAHCTLTAVQ